MQTSIINIEKCKKLVNKELVQFFQKRIKEVEKLHPSSKEIMEIIEEFTLRGGKRLRSAFIFYGYKCFAKNKRLDKEIIKAAQSIELSQSFLLMHDDIMDKSEIRRCKITVHKQYENIAKKHRYKDSEHFGTSMAILAGDISSCLSNLILANLKIKPKLKLRAITKLNQVIHKVTYGQITDILLATKEKVSEKDILFTNHMKTATYTIEGPLHIGAILAGATNKKLKILSNYAVPLGQAFQLQDDILDFFGSEGMIGKTPGSDLREGKKTLLILKALEKADKKQKQTILKNLGKKQISKKQIEKIKKILIDTGSLEYSQNLIKDLVQRSKDSIEKAKIKKQGKDFLLGIADYMLEREN